MTDEDRNKRATLSGGRWFGPLERQRCEKHPRRWITFRWVWGKDEDISSSEPQVERGCASCAEEDTDE